MGRRQVKIQGKVELDFSTHSGLSCDGVITSFKQIGSAILPSAHTSLILNEKMTPLHVRLLYTDLIPSIDPAILYKDCNETVSEIFDTFWDRKSL